MTPARGARRAALAAAGLLAAGCGSDDSAGCGLCGTPAVAPGDGVVWAAQGKNVFHLDPSTGRIVGATAVMADRRGSDVQAITADGSIGVAGWSGAVAGVGPSGRMVFRHGRRPPGYVLGMVTAGGRIWLGAGRRAIALAADGSVLMRPRLPARVTGLAAGDGVVWAVGGRMRRVKTRGRGWTVVPAGPGYAVAIDAATGRRLHRFETPPGPLGVAVGGGGIWVASPLGLDQLDAATGRSLRHAKASPGSVATGAGRLWSLDGDGTLTRRDPDTGLPQGSPTTLGDVPGRLAADADGVWVGVGGGYRDPEVVRIDRSTLRVAWRTRIPVT